MSALPFHISTAEIIRRVSCEMNLSADEILSPCRKQSLVRARAAIVWLALGFNTTSRRGVGRRLGRGHTSIKNLIAKAEMLRRTEPAFRTMTNRILQEGNTR